MKPPMNGIRKITVSGLAAFIALWPAPASAEVRISKSVDPVTGVTTYSIRPVSQKGRPTTRVATAPTAKPGPSGPAPTAAHATVASSPVVPNTTDLFSMESVATAVVSAARITAEVVATVVAPAACAAAKAVATVVTTAAHVTTEIVATAAASAAHSATAFVASRVSTGGRTAEAPVATAPASTTPIRTTAAPATTVRAAAAPPVSVVAAAAVTAAPALPRMSAPAAQPARNSQSQMVSASAQFPTIGAALQRERDNERLIIIAEELHAEEVALKEAMTNNASQDIIRRYEGNVAALRREVERLNDELARRPRDKRKAVAAG